MTQENTRLDRAFAVLEALEQPGPCPSRVSAALQSLREFPLTGASDAVRDAVESFGTTHNEMVRGYPAASSDTAVEFDDEDARELARHLRQVAELVRDVETERILGRLRHHGGVLPEEEINETRRHQGWFIPHLMRELRDQITRLKQLAEVDDRLPDEQHNSIPFFSSFLFAEWHVSDSIPVILEGLRLPGEGPFELFGDAVHDEVPRYLAQFLAGQLDQIDAIIRDAQVNLYVRWSSANSYKYLVRDQVMSVDDAVARLDRLFDETKITADDGSPGLGHCHELSAGIVAVVCGLGGISRSTIFTDDQAWKFIDESIVGLDDVTESSGASGDWEPTDELLRLPPTRVSDCLEDLRYWAAFEPQPRAVPNAPAPKVIERSRPAASRPSAPSSLPASNKPVQQAARVPRNAPCPCGSGKKYKQCCRRKDT